jgi:hypothetical protein
LIREFLHVCLLVVGEPYTNGFLRPMAIAVKWLEFLEAGKELFAAEL